MSLFLIYLSENGIISSHLFAVELRRLILSFHLSL
jgi:hypothetical protein